MGAGYSELASATSWKAGRFTGSDFAFQPDGSLRCPAGKSLWCGERRPEADGSWRLVYEARIADCRACSWREQCQWHGHQARHPRRMSLLLHPRQGGSASLLWRDWPRREHRRACMQLLRHQRLEVHLPPAQETLAPPLPAILSRAQRAHYRLSHDEPATAHDHLVRRPRSLRYFPGTAGGVSSSGCSSTSFSSTRSPGPGALLAPLFCSPLARFTFCSADAPPFQEQERCPAYSSRPEARITSVTTSLRYSWARVAPRLSGVAVCAQTPYAPCPRHRSTATVHPRGSGKGRGRRRNWPRRTPTRLSPSAPKTHLWSRVPQHLGVPVGKKRVESYQFCWWPASSPALAMCLESGSTASPASFPQVHISSVL